MQNQIFSDHQNQEMHHHDMNVNSTHKNHTCHMDSLNGQSKTSCVCLVPIFNHLEPNQLEEISNVAHSVSFKKGEVIYHANDESDSLYIVDHGKVKIYRLSESGKEQLIRILQEGDFTGELAIFSETIHETYAEAMEDTRMCIVKRSDLQELLMRYPTISLKLLSEFSSRLGQSEKQAARFATEKVETRIALYLVECMDQHKDIMEISLPMSKKDLASFLGTTPETISRKLTELEDAGLIRQKSQRKIEILDVEGLKLI